MAKNNNNTTTTTVSERFEKWVKINPRNMEIISSILDRVNNASMNSEVDIDPPIRDAVLEELMKFRKDDSIEKGINKFLNRIRNNLTISEVVSNILAKAKVIADRDKVDYVNLEICKEALRMSLPIHADSPTVSANTSADTSVEKEVKSAEEEVKSAEEEVKSAELSPDEMAKNLIIDTLVSIGDTISNKQYASDIVTYLMYNFEDICSGNYSLLMTAPHLDSIGDTVKRIKTILSQAPQVSQMPEFDACGPFADDMKKVYSILLQNCKVLGDMSAAAVRLSIQAADISDNMKKVFRNHGVGCDICLRELTDVTARELCNDQSLIYKTRVRVTDELMKSEIIPA